MKWWTGVGGLVLACTMALTVRAQPAAPLPVTPAKLALAQQVIDSANIVRAVSLAMNSMLNPFVQQINAGAGSTELKTYTVSLLHSEVSTMQVKMEPLYAEIYARTFDERQLSDILAFYQSPTGRLMVEKQVELSREGQLAVAPLVPEMQRDMIDKMFAHVCEMQKCSPDQRKQMANAEAQLLVKFAPQTPVPATASPAQ